MDEKEATSEVSKPKGVWLGPPGSNKNGGKLGQRKPSQSLMAARRVSKRPEAENERGLVKMYRDLQKKNPGGFLASLRQMEKEHRALLVETAPGEAKEAEAEDVGGEKALGVLAGWLSEQGVSQ